jgi:hypothetical protein
MGVIVRKYGILQPMNWGKDCSDHLFLQNKLWNRLVEIYRENRNAYASLIGSDNDVAVINSEIDAVKLSLIEMGNQRKELRKSGRAKTGVHTERLDQKNSEAKLHLKSLLLQSKEKKIAAKEQINAASTALKDLSAHHYDLIKDARNASGLWWGNYNAVCKSYDIARSRALKTGAELNFHRFDGSGRFTCQIQGGMSVKDLLSGSQAIAQIRLVDGTTFMEAAGCNPPSVLLQEVGSRRDSRQYGILSITVYTCKVESGSPTRRMLDFPIILHRPLPEDGVLKELHVNRRRVGADFEWSATLTFSSDLANVANASTLECGINVGWKVVADGMRIATISDNLGNVEHITLPTDVSDRLAYADNNLKSRIDTLVNDSFAWLLDCWSGDIPESLVDVRSMLRRAKKPNETKFAKAVFMWRECSDFMPSKLAEAELKRKAIKRLSNEFSNLKDKVLRRRLDFYRVVTGKLAEKYSRIVLDKIDLSELARLESKNGMPTELNGKARRNRVVASVSEFRQWLENQCKKTGSVVEYRLIRSTHICSVCGCSIEPQEGLYLACSECQTVIDRDENASTNLLMAA